MEQAKTSRVNRTDHSLLLAAIIAGVARWESFPNTTMGEVCVDGIRHVVRLDRFGCPELTNGARGALKRGLGK